METTGIMQEVRELLARAKSSREIIDLGYAPGTVYRVQHQFRRQAKLAQTHAGQSPQATPKTERTASLDASVNALVDRLQHCQEERAGLQSEVERLRAVEEEANRMRSRLSARAGELELVKAERARLNSKVVQLTDEIRQINQQLREIRFENINLKGYLRSRNCGWERDFVLYVERRDQPRIFTCTYQRAASQNSTTPRY